MQAEGEVTPPVANATKTLGNPALLLYLSSQNRPVTAAFLRSVLVEGRGGEKGGEGTTKKGKAKATKVALHSDVLIGAP